MTRPEFQVDTCGWLKGVTVLESPNFNSRPLSCQPNLLVIHNISLPPRQFGGGYIQRFFCNQLDCNEHEYFQQIADLEVSAHLLVERDGKVTQFVSFNNRAWHAGASEFQGLANCNDFSIGIELEGTDELPYTDKQYVVLASITQVLMKAYPEIELQRIVGHSDIAPGRKTDPGKAFDWGHFGKLLG